MFFTSPVPFREALEQTRAALPTDLSSAELARIRADILESARFSARTGNAWYLGRIDEITRRLASPETIEGRAAQAGEYMDPATARAALREALQAIGYHPGTDFNAPVPGSLRDLSSDTRLDLVVQMNRDFAWGYGRYQAGSDPAALDAWPAQELFRLEEREHKRDWISVWQAAGGQLYDGDRMIALKADAIWTDISEFGLPYPPFAYGSGMWVRDISRGEAEDFGLLQPGEPAPSTEPRSLDQGLQASVAGLSEGLQRAALEDLGDGYELSDGVLRRRGGGSAA